MPVTTARRERGVSVVASGRLTQRLCEQMLDTVRASLIDVPRSVVVDLSAVTGLTAAGVAALLALADLALDWPESPVVLVATDPLSTQLHTTRLAEHLVVRPTVVAAYAAVGNTPRVVVDRLYLARSSAAPAIARHFVRDHLPLDASQHLRDSAALVVTELVTNAVLHGGPRMQLRMVRRGRGLRLAVGDARSPEGPAAPAPEAVPVDDGDDPIARGEDGRRLMVVPALSARFGVLPSASGGTVVWSLLDDEPPPVMSGAC